MAPSFPYTCGGVVRFSALLLLVGACSSDSRAALGDGVDGGADGVDGAVEVGSDGAVDRPDAGSQSSDCVVPGPAIVTDIDATLTTSDLEWLMQMGWGAYEPTERSGAAALVNGYAERGYYILYLTARPANYTLIGTSETAPEATLRWLEDHGYPVDPEHTRLELAPDIIIDATATTDYKTGVLTAMEDEGFSFDYAYGNAATDITAYENAGIAKDHTFIIGSEGGNGGTVAIAGDGWDDHDADFLPTVPAVCAP